MWIEYDVRVFWAGDSRCCWVKQKGSYKKKSESFECLTEDHRPDNPKEAVRVTRAGGAIINNRVVKFFCFLFYFHGIFAVFFAIFSFSFGATREVCWKCFRKCTQSA